MRTVNAHASFKDVFIMTCAGGYRNAHVYAVWHACVQLLDIVCAVCSIQHAQELHR